MGASDELRARLERAERPMSGPPRRSASWAAGRPTLDPRLWPGNQRVAARCLRMRWKRIRRAEWVGSRNPQAARSTCLTGGGCRGRLVDTECGRHRRSPRRSRSAARPGTGAGRNLGDDLGERRFRAVVLGAARSFFGPHAWQLSDFGRHRACTCNDTLYVGEITTARLKFESRHPPVWQPGQHAHRWTQAWVWVLTTTRTDGGSRRRST